MALPHQPVLQVLHVTPYFENAWAYGGIPRVVSAQVRGCAERGLRLSVLSTDACSGSTRLGLGSGLRQPARILCRPGLELFVFRNLSNRLAYRYQLFLPLGLDRFLRQRLNSAAAGWHLAHLHGCHNLPGALAARRLRRAGIPYLLQPNGTAPRIERRRLAKLLFDASIGRGVLPGAARVIAVSRAEHAQLQRLGVAAERIVSLPNPLDLDELDRRPGRGRFRSRFGIPEQDDMVLYLGQLSPRKRVDVAVRAVAAMAEPRPRLVIAGSDMGCAGRLRRLAEQLGLGDRVLLTGTLAAEQRLAALVDADVVVYPTEHEIFGLVPLEALCCGTPVVVCDDCGCGEIIAEIGGGRVVPVADRAAVAAAITELLRDRDGWQQAVQDAARQIRERFGAAAVCEQLHGIYAGLVGDAATGTP